MYLRRLSNGLPKLFLPGRRNCSKRGSREASRFVIGSTIMVVGLQLAKCRASIGRKWEWVPICRLLAMLRAGRQLPLSKDLRSPNNFFPPKKQNFALRRSTIHCWLWTLRLGLSDASYIEGGLTRLPSTIMLFKLVSTWERIGP